jgi:5-methyltetrahydrofolate--homocysteine methyltransferase
LAIQKRYVEAGADCIITNTFGGSCITLKRHGVAKDVHAINQAGARIAREAFSGRAGFVLGDIGPVGAILEPYGDLSQDEARAALEEQAAALVEGGADAIIIETQTSLEELGLAIDAAKAVGARSVIASLAYDLSADKTFFVTMMGVQPGQAAEFAEERGANIIALNCGTGMDMAGAAKVAELYREHSPLPVMVQPNAGLPILEKGKAVYKQTPEDMVAALPGALAVGADIIGSCCGSTPEHTRAIRRVVDEFNRKKL